MGTKNQATVWIVVAALLGLLLGCVGGIVIGGVAGYALFRSSPTPVAPQPFEFRIEPTPPAPVVPDLRPMPTVPLLRGGALITQVVPQSPAERAGLQVGDMITAWNGVELSDVPLAEQIVRYAPGDQVTLTVWRANRELQVKVTLGTHPDRAGAPWIGIYYQQLPGGRPFEQPAP